MVLACLSSLSRCHTPVSRHGPAILQPWQGCRRAEEVKEGLMEGYTVSSKRTVVYSTPQLSRAEAFRADGSGSNEHALTLHTDSGQTEVACRAFTKTRKVKGRQAAVKGDNSACARSGLFGWNVLCLGFRFRISEACCVSLLISTTYCERWHRCMMHGSLQAVDEQLSRLKQVRAWCVASTFLRVG